MKKLLSFALALVMVLALSVPAVSAAPAGFIGGTVAASDKNGYNKFVGTEITANNSAKVFDNFSFIADNKTLNAWYINVTKDISGTLEVAYKVGSAYYVVKFDIGGPGKYWIGDSKGSNGVNMVKIGAFEQVVTPVNYIVTYDWGGGPDYLFHPRPVRVTVPAGMYTVYMDNILGNPVHLLGWSTDPDATKVEYYNGDEILVESNITLYAVFPTHVHDYIAVVTAPTCTEDGFTTYTCSRCADEYVDDYEPALGHVWVTDVTVTLTNPTCRIFDSGFYAGQWFWSADVTMWFNLSDGSTYEHTFIQYIFVAVATFLDDVPCSWVFSSWELNNNLFPGLRLCKNVSVHFAARWTTTGGDLDTLGVTVNDVYFVNGDDFICD